MRCEYLSVDGADNEDKTRVIAGTVILARANIKFSVWGLFYTKHEPDENNTSAEKNNEKRIVFRVDYTF